MKRYCIDTSGLSNPLETMPEDIFGTLWENAGGLITSGVFACTTEIFDELVLIPGTIGKLIKHHKSDIIMEIEDSSWNWEGYVKFSGQMNQTHHGFISEYTGGSPKTINLADLSIIALAKTLALPVISMEVDVQNSPTKRRIPNICKSENIKHLSFTEFLRKEKISV